MAWNPFAGPEGKKALEEFSKQLKESSTEEYLDAMPAKEELAKFANKKVDMELNPFDLALGNGYTECELYDTIMEHYYGIIESMCSDEGAGPTIIGSVYKPQVWDCHKAMKESYNIYDNSDYPYVYNVKCAWKGREWDPECVADTWKIGKQIRKVQRFLCDNLVYIIYKDKTGEEVIDLATASIDIGEKFFGDRSLYTSAILHENKAGNFIAFKLDPIGGFNKVRVSILNINLSGIVKSGGSIACVPVDSISAVEELLLSNFMTSGIYEVNYIDTVKNSTTYGKRLRAIVPQFNNEGMKKVIGSLNGFQECMKQLDGVVYKHGLDSKDKSLTSTYFVRLPAVTKTEVKLLPVSLFAITSVKRIK